MATELKDYIKVYDNVLSESICDTILTEFHSSETTYIDREQRPTFTDLNISILYQEDHPRWISSTAKLMEVFNNAVSRYMEELDIGPDFPDRYAYEQFRIKHYNNNGHDQFRDHVDVGNHNSAKRFLVLFLYLNDVEVGGETVFPRLDFSVKPKCGRILLFPPTWQYRHAGLPPVSEPKSIVGSYLHYL